MVERRAGLSDQTSMAASWPLVSLEELLAPHMELITRIKLCHGSSRDEFERDLLPLIRGYASFVHLLPATATSYFSHRGGLLQLGLETGLFSLQGTDAHIFSGRSTITERRQVEPRWRLATFIAGLCAEAHRALSQVVVTNSSGTTWPGYLRSLFDWLRDSKSDHYFVRWQLDSMDTRMLGVFAVSQIVPTAVVQYLSEHNSVIVSHLMASVAGVGLYRERNVLDELVRRSLALVIDRNLKSEMSRVWYGLDGLFLMWPNAADDLIKLIEIDQLVGIPKTPDVLLQVLIAAGAFVAHDAENPLWTIKVPTSNKLWTAVRLSSAAVLCASSDNDMAPLDLVLANQPAREAPSPLPSARVATLGPLPAAGDAPSTSSDTSMPATPLTSQIEPVQASEPVPAAPADQDQLHPARALGRAKAGMIGHDGFVPESGVSN